MWGSWGDAGPMMGFGGGMGFGGMGFGGGGGKGAWGSGKGSGKWGKKKKEEMYDVLVAALEPALHMETQWTPQEVAKRIHKYLQNGTKNIEFGQISWEQGLDEYCDNFFGTMIKACADRDWVCEVDWNTVLMAAIQETFPPGTLSWVDEAVLATAVASSAERAFEEARYWYGTNLWEVMQNLTASKPTQKKIYNALDAGRKEAWDNARTSGDEYLRTWISGTIRNLAITGGEQPDQILPGEAAAQLFVSLVGSGALPITGDIGQEPQRDENYWSSVIFLAVQEAYSQDFGAVQTLGGKGKGKGKGYANQGYNSNKGYEPYGGKGSDMMGNRMMEMMNQMAAMNQMMGMMGKGGW